MVCSSASICDSISSYSLGLRVICSLEYTVSSRSDIIMLIK